MSSSLTLLRVQLEMDGDHFSVIVSHLRHKTLEPNAPFGIDMVKPERRGQFKAMLDFLGLREFFSDPCGCSTEISPPQFLCTYCNRYFQTQRWTPTNGKCMCSDCHPRKCPIRAM